MTIALNKESRAAAVASIERWFDENVDPDEPIGKVGNIRAAALLHFFLEEIAPSVYNQAVAAVQERLITRVNELDIECFEDEFGYWAKQRKR